MKQQFTGMTGVYLVAAELSKREFIASPTSRSAVGADVLVTDAECNNSYSVQVKTNTKNFSYWLLSKKSATICSRSHIYVFVNLRKSGDVEYFVVPSQYVVDNLSEKETNGRIWYSISREAVEEYQDKWRIFEKPSEISRLPTRRGPFTRPPKRVKPTAA